MRLLDPYTRKHVCLRDCWKGDVNLDPGCSCSDLIHLLHGVCMKNTTSPSVNSSVIIQWHHSIQWGRFYHCNPMDVLLVSRLSTPCSLIREEREMSTCVQTGNSEARFSHSRQHPGWWERVSVPKPAEVGRLPNRRYWLKTFGYALKINYFIHPTMLYSWSLGTQKCPLFIFPIAGWV